jgi:lysophospholipase L1-like esterase
MRLLALGDSYTAGEGVAPEESWPHLLKRGRPALKTTIIARTGWTSAELLGALVTRPPDAGFDVATVMVGVNDQYRGLPIEKYERNVAAVVEIARRSAIRVLAISIPDWSVTAHGADFGQEAVAIEIDAFNHALGQVAARYRLPYVDVTAISRAHPQMVATDGLHPSPAQHELWTAEIGRTLD